METLRHYWFPCEPGPGIGVTAFNLDEARGLAENALVYLPGATITGVEEDVDVETLDSHLILPDLGPPAVHGIWYPMLNV
jgi:hypothetical protein